MPSPPKPDWIRVRAPNSRGYADTRKIVRDNGLVTVCEEAGCPNIGECWDKKHATFMIMGDTCTRACAFCNVKTGMPEALEAGRAGARGAMRSQSSAWRMWSITSVDRDDLADGGAEHFARTVSRHPRAVSVDHDRNPDAGFPAQGRRAGAGRCGEARRVQPQPGNRAVALSLGAARRALLPLRPPVAAGQGNRPARSSPSPASWSGSARSGTRCCR